MTALHYLLCGLASLIWIYVATRMIMRAVFRSLDERKECERYG